MKKMLIQLANADAEAGKNCRRILNAFNYLPHITISGFNIIDNL